MEKLTELVQVRVTPSLQAALLTKAKEMHLRLPDVYRWALAQSIYDAGINGEVKEQVTQ